MRLATKSGTVLLRIPIGLTECGQLCVILGDYDAVITVTSHNEGEASNILRAMWTQILPKLEAS